MVLLLLGGGVALAKIGFGLGLHHRPAFFSFFKAALDLVQDEQALEGVVKRGVVREFRNGADDLGLCDGGGRSASVCIRGSNFVFYPTLSGQARSSGSLLS